MGRGLVVALRSRRELPPVDLRSQDPGALRITPQHDKIILVVNHTVQPNQQTYQNYWTLYLSVLVLFLRFNSIYTMVFSSTLVKRALNSSIEETDFPFTIWIVSPSLSPIL